MAPACPHRNTGRRYLLQSIMAAHAGSWQNHILTPLADLDRATSHTLPARSESARAGFVQDPADQCIRSSRYPVVSRTGIALTRMQRSVVLA